MKSILISIKPKWCEVIESLKKKIEVRKTAPKLKTPFKCNIYCTEINPKTDWSWNYKPHLYSKCGKLKWLDTSFDRIMDWHYANQKVIGEFVCDRVDKIEPCFEYYSDGYDIDDDTIIETCLTREEIMNYGKGKLLYGWHISDLKIYDKPKELSEFVTVCKTYNSDKDDKCWGCSNLRVAEGNKEAWIGNCISKYRPFTRPPQSWCYVE